MTSPTTPPSEETLARAARVAERMYNLVGEVHRIPGYYEVGREKIREFAVALQDDHPAHHTVEGARKLGYDNLIAPITFMSVLGASVVEFTIENVIDDYDTAGLLQIDQQFEMHNPLTVGDRLVCDVHLASFRQAAGSDLIVLENQVSDQHGTLKVTSRSTFMARSGAEPDPAVAAATAGVVAVCFRAPAK